MKYNCMKLFLFFLFIGMMILISGSGTLQAQNVKIDGMYYYIEGDNTVSITGGNVQTTTYTIPSEVIIRGKVYQVTKIKNKNGYKAANKSIFKDKTDKLQPYPWGTIVQKIIVPPSVKDIGTGAFYSQKSLKEVVLPETVKNINPNAFTQCVNLKRINIPAGTDIAYEAFCKAGIKKMDLSKTRMTKLNLKCFKGCRLDTLYLPKTLQEITYDSMDDALGFNLLVSIDYESLKKISTQDKIFHFLYGIKRLIIRNVEILQRDDVSMLRFLRELEIPVPAKEIGEETFEEYKVGYLEKVILGNSIVKIGKNAFHNQTKLKEIQFSSSLKSIGSNAFDGCTSLKKIEIPLSVSEIGEYAFYLCLSLADVKGLNSNIDYAGNTFRGCEFEKTLPKIQKSFSYYALGVISKELAEWQQKKVFETTAQWKTRVTPESREKQVKQLLERAKQQYIDKPPIPKREEYTLGNYDSDYNTFSLDFEELGKQYVKVPLNEAPAFKDNLQKAKIQHTWGIRDDHLAIVGLSVTIGNKTYRSMPAVVEDNTSEFLADLPPLDIDIGGNDKPTREKTPDVTDNGVDVNIPETDAVAEKTFAVIIANETYTHEAKVPFALNDGEVFARYCRKTLGIPEKNIRVVKNATLNDTKFQLNWLSQVLTAYNGTAKAIVYYAGHGIPDEKQQSAYLLPADGYGSDASTGYALNDFYASLSDTPAQNITVFLDACFSGTKRENGMLASARGVAIKVRQEVPRGKMVVFSAAQGDETAYQYKEKGHGMFTYFLLKKLQETKGNATLGELGDYIISEVKKNSIVNNNKLQTPTVIPSAGMTETWKEETLK